MGFRASCKSQGTEEQSSKRQFGDNSRPTYSTVARKGIESDKRPFVDLFKSNLLRDSVGSGTTFAFPNRLDLKYPQTAVWLIFARASLACRYHLRSSMVDDNDKLKHIGHHERLAKRRVHPILSLKPNITGANNGRDHLN